MAFHTISVTCLMFKKNIKHFHITPKLNQSNQLIENKSIFLCKIHRYFNLQIFLNFTQFYRNNRTCHEKKQFECLIRKYCVHSFRNAICYITIPVRAYIFKIGNSYQCSQLRKKCGILLKT